MYESRVLCFKNTTDYLCRDRKEKHVLMEQQNVLYPKWGITQMWVELSSEITERSSGDEINNNIFIYSNF